MRACLAISSFRDDETVIKLLERAAADGALELFDRVIVVDSIGTGEMPERLARAGFQQVEYHCADRNLGSAGNFAERLELAAAGPEQVAYTVNHDGSVERQTVERLLSAASAQKRFGAVYPLRKLKARGGSYDVSGRWSVPVPRRTAEIQPDSPLLDVWWSSSNGALYSLAPVRAGVTPWADLWMGWEDLGFGWLLARERYPQFIVTGAVTEDNYELRRIPGGAYVSDKPCWYAYYMARNLLLVTRRTKPGALRSAAVVGRVAFEVAVTLAIRDDKRRRLRYLAAGVSDGLRGRSGKWSSP